ncbi:MAG: hypothetical protein JWO38_4598 [Gemmataceae bacterium]|nr:hypothetical protein [Gemmataceae bacterium]
MPHDTFTVGDLTAVIGDNDAQGQHRAGYNGLWSLTHKTEPTNLFVPIVAGLNFEHIFDGETVDPPGKTAIFFEPRNAKMTLRKLSAAGAELYQPPTPTFHLESTSRFTLREPDIIDLDFRFTATQHAFKRKYLGLFWASYINAPDDKSMYLRGKNLWLQHCPPAHNAVSTVAHERDAFELTFAKDHRDCLYKNLSPVRYDVPLFYGLFNKHIFVMMFDRSDGLRLTQSPTGGGVNTAAQTTNPAWDFQYVLPTYEVNKEYRLRARAIYRERCPREQVLKEYESWRKELDGAG